MFSNFHVDPSGTRDPERRASQGGTPPVKRRRTERTPVPVACNNCRKSRTKCSNSIPCNNCKHRNLTCSNADNANPRELIRKVQALVGKVEELENRLQQHARDTPAIASTQPHEPLQSPPPSSHSPTSAQTPAVSSSGHGTATPATNTEVGQLNVNLSSDAFAARLDQAFERHGWSLGQSVSLLSFSSSEPPADETSNHHSNSTNLLRHEEEYYIRLFWRQIHRTFPVIGEDDFASHYASLWNAGSGQSPRRASSLVDIVLALAVQLDFDSRPQLRHEFNAHGDDARGQGRAWTTARNLYHSSLEGLNREWESPTWRTLQCYILMVVYLRKEGRHNSAYQMLGFAVRVSNILGINQPAFPSAPPKDLLLRDQMRDFLLCLDTQQFLEVARPCSLAPCAPQRHLHIDPQDASYWYYWSDLLTIAKSIHLTLSSMLLKSGTQLDEHNCPNDSAIRSFERLLPALMVPLSLWTKTVPRRLRLQRNSAGSSFSTDATVNIDADIPIWQARQSLHLELSYHWVKMNLARWFLDHHDLGQEQTDELLDDCGDQAVEHAFTIVEILSRAHGNTEAIRGWYDAHLIHWDAVLVLFGYLMWRHDGPRCDEVASMLRKSSSTFQSLGTSFPRHASSIIENFDTSLKQRRGSQQSSSMNIAMFKCPAPLHMSHLNLEDPHLTQSLLDNDLLTNMEFDLDVGNLGSFSQLHHSMLINDDLDAE